MEIKQKTIIEVEKNGKVIQLICDQDQPLGTLFDAVMEIKGFCVERMAKAHADEQKEAAEKMGDEPCEKECEQQPPELPEALEAPQAPEAA